MNPVDATGPIDNKLYAALTCKDHLTGTPFTGLSTELVLDYVLKFEQFLPRAVVTDLKQLKEAVQNVSAEDTAKAVARGERVLRIGGYTGHIEGHAMIYEACPQQNSFTIYNGGDGIHMHASQKRGAKDVFYPRWTLVSVPIESLSRPELWKKLAEIRTAHAGITGTTWGGAQVYDFVHLMLGGDIRNYSSESLEWFKSQNSAEVATCSLNAVLCFLKVHMLPPAYRALLFAMKSGAVEGMLKRSDPAWEESCLINWSVPQYAETAGKRFNEGLISEDQYRKAVELSKTAAEKTCCSEHPNQLRDSIRKPWFAACEPPETTRPLENVAVAPEPEYEGVLDCLASKPWSQKFGKAPSTGDELAAWMVKVGDHFRSLKGSGRRSELVLFSRAICHAMHELPGSAWEAIPKLTHGPTANTLLRILDCLVDSTEMKPQESDCIEFYYLYSLAARVAHDELSARYQIKDLFNYRLAPKSLGELFKVWYSPSLFPVSHQKLFAALEHFDGNEKPQLFFEVEETGNMAGAWLPKNPLEHDELRFLKAVLAAVAKESGKSTEEINELLADPTNIIQALTAAETVSYPSSLRTCFAMYLKLWAPGKGSAPTLRLWNIVDFKRWSTIYFEGERSNKILPTLLIETLDSRHHAQISAQHYRLPVREVSGVDDETNDSRLPYTKLEHLNTSEIIGLWKETPSLSDSGSGRAFIRYQLFGGYSGDAARCCLDMTLSSKQAPDTVMRLRETLRVMASDALQARNAELYAFVAQLSWDCEQMISATELPTANAPVVSEEAILELAQGAASLPEGFWLSTLGALLQQGSRAVTVPLIARALTAQRSRKEHYALERLFERMQLQVTERISEAEHQGLTRKLLALLEKHCSLKSSSHAVTVEGSTLQLDETHALCLATGLVLKNDKPSCPYNYLLSASKTWQRAARGLSPAQCQMFGESRSHLQNRDDSLRVAVSKELKLQICIDDALMATKLRAYAPELRIPDLSKQYVYSEKARDEPYTAVEHPWTVQASPMLPDALIDERYEVWQAMDSSHAFLITSSDVSGRPQLLHLSFSPTEHDNDQVQPKIRNLCDGLILAGPDFWYQSACLDAFKRVNPVYDTLLLWQDGQGRAARVELPFLALSFTTADAPQNKISWQSEQHSGFVIDAQAPDFEMATHPGTVVLTKGRQQLLYLFRDECERLYPLELGYMRETQLKAKPKRYLLSRELRGDAVPCFSGSLEAQLYVLERLLLLKNYDSAHRYVCSLTLDTQLSEDEIKALQALNKTSKQVACPQGDAILTQLYSRLCFHIDANQIAGLLKFADEVYARYINRYSKVPARLRLGIEEEQRFSPELTELTRSTYTRVYPAHMTALTGELPSAQKEGSNRQAIPSHLSDSSLSSIAGCDFDRVTFSWGFKGTVSTALKDESFLQMFVQRRWLEYVALYLKALAEANEAGRMKILSQVTEIMALNSRDVRGYRVHTFVSLLRIPFAKHPFKPPVDFSAALENLPEIKNDDSKQRQECQKVVLELLEKVCKSVRAEYRRAVAPEPVSVNNSILNPTGYLTRANPTSLLHELAERVHSALKQAKWTGEPLPTLGIELQKVEQHAQGPSTEQVVGLGDGGRSPIEKHLFAELKKGRVRALQTRSPLSEFHICASTNTKPSSFWRDLIERHLNPNWKGAGLHSIHLQRLAIAKQRKKLTVGDAVTWMAAHQQRDQNSEKTDALAQLIMRYCATTLLEQHQSVPQRIFSRTLGLGCTVLAYELRTGKILRSYQEKTVQSILEGKDNQVHCLPCGSGKTDVLTPVIAGLFSAKGKLVINVVLKELLPTHLPIVRKAMLAAYGRNIYVFEFDRVEPGSSKKAKRVLERLKICQKEQLLVVSTPDALQSLLLSACESVLYWVDNPKQTGAFAAASHYLKVLDYLSVHSVILADEIHRILRSNWELNFGLKSERVPEAFRQQVPLTIYREIIKLSKAGHRFPFGDHAGKPPTAKTYYADLLPPLAKALAQSYPAKDRSGAEAYFLARRGEVGKNKRKKLNKWLNELDPTVRKQTKLTRAHLVKYLPLCLALTCFVQFGPSPVAAEAVPYEANNTPALDSSFSFYDCVVNLTSQMKLLDGLSEEQVMSLMESLQRVHRHTQNPNSGDLTRAEKTFARFIKVDRKLDALNLSNPAQKEQYLEPLKRSVEAIMYVLEHSVIPEISLQERKLHSSGLDVVNMASRWIGWSANVERSVYFPDDVSYHYSVSDREDRTRILLDPQYCAISLVDEISMETIAKEKRLSVLLDPGPHFAGVRNEVVAERLLKELPETVKAVIYFAHEDDQPMQLQRAGTARQYQAGLIDDADIVWYKDERHCTGHHSSAPMEGVGVIPIARGMTFTSLYQASERLRRLGAHQALKLLVPRELIAKIVGDSTRGAPTHQEIVEWTIRNEAIQLAGELPKGFEELLFQDCRWALIRSMIQQSGSPAELSELVQKNRALLEEIAPQEPFAEDARLDSAPSQAEKLRESCKHYAKQYGVLDSKLPAKLKACAERGAQLMSDSNGVHKGEEHLQTAQQQSTSISREQVRNPNCYYDYRRWKLSKILTEEPLLMFCKNEPSRQRGASESSSRQGLSVSWISDLFHIPGPNSRLVISHNFLHCSKPEDLDVAHKDFAIRCRFLRKCKRVLSIQADAEPPRFVALADWEAERLAEEMHERNGEPYPGFTCQIMDLDGNVEKAVGASRTYSSKELQPLIAVRVLNGKVNYRTDELPIVKGLMGTERARRAFRTLHTTRISDVTRDEIFNGSHMQQIFDKVK